MTVMNAKAGQLPICRISSKLNVCVNLLKHNPAPTNIDQIPSTKRVQEHTL